MELKRIYSVTDSFVVHGLILGSEVFSEVVGLAVGYMVAMRLGSEVGAVDGFGKGEGLVGLEEGAKVGFEEGLDVGIKEG